MTHFRKTLLAIAAVLLIFLLGVLLGHSRRASSPSVTNVTSDHLPAAPIAEGETPTTLYAHNLRLRQGPLFRVYVRWIRGQMLRTQTKVVPTFDDPESFVLEIQRGVMHVNIGDIADYLNAVAPSDAPLRHISIDPNGKLLTVHGIFHKVLPMPVELVCEIAPAPDGRVIFHVTKINVLKLPMKGLLGGLHLQLSDLVHSAKIPGVQISGNDILFDTQRLLPPPHIHGQITSITVDPPDVEVIYGGAHNDEARLSQWHNFLRLTGGSVSFGKLTMRDADLTMVDASDDPWFGLDLVHYQSQLVHGYSRINPQGGLEIFMPDLDTATNGGTLTLDWLRNRNTTIPKDIPIK